MQRHGLIRFLVVVLASLFSNVSGVAQAEGQGVERASVEYRLLATNRTSTMQSEMQAAGAAGFRFEDVIGGETSFGGSEVVVIMSRLADSEPRYEYRLLATSKTSTMQTELQEVGDAGFNYLGQTVFSTTFGGSEAVVILERDREEPVVPMYEYRVLATNRTSTMERELTEAGRQGFVFVGVTVAPTTFGGDEIVSILRRRAAE